MHSEMGHGQSAPPPPQLQYPKIENLWYNQKVVRLDGWNFYGCRFDNCRLIIETPYFILNNCYIDGSNTIELHGSLMNAVRFLNITSHGAGHSTYKPVRNIDGTISIGA
jgi:hypothetical protein